MSLILSTISMSLITTVGLILAYFNGALQVFPGSSGMDQIAIVPSRDPAERKTVRAKNTNKQTQRWAYWAILTELQEHAGKGTNPKYAWKQWRTFEGSEGKVVPKNFRLAKCDTWFISSSSQRQYRRTQKSAYWREIVFLSFGAQEYDSK